MTHWTTACMTHWHINQIWELLKQYLKCVCVCACVWKLSILLAGIKELKVCCVTVCMGIIWGIMQQQFLPIYLWEWLWEWFNPVMLHVSNMWLWKPFMPSIQRHDSCLCSWDAGHPNEVWPRRTLEGKANPQSQKHLQVWDSLKDSVSISFTCGIEWCLIDSFQELQPGIVEWNISFDKRTKLESEPEHALHKCKANTTHFVLIWFDMI